MRHRLDLVVRDVDHRRGDVADEAAWISRAHLVAQLARRGSTSGSSNRNMLGIADDRATDGDALALTAGELASDSVRAGASMSRILAA
jgi:hypothetical protein